MERVIVVSGKCKLCGHVAVGALPKINSKFKAICPKHGRQEYQIFSAVLRDKKEAEEILKGGLF